MIKPKLRKRPIIDKKSCAGCSLCVENCPLDCLAIGAPQYRGDIYTIAELIWPEQCIGCGICAQACPIAAITIKEEA